MTTRRQSRISASLDVISPGDKSFGWKHPHELSYPRSSDWPDLEIIPFLINNAISIPPRTTSSQAGRSAAKFPVTSSDGKVTKIISSYRIPLLWVVTYQWRTLWLVLRAWTPQSRERLWQQYKMRLVYITLVYNRLLETASSGSNRCPAFDRVLHRIKDGYIEQIPQEIEAYWNELGGLRYKEDVLQNDWRKTIKSPQIGRYVLVDHDIEVGVTISQLTGGLQQREGQWEWSHSDYWIVTSSQRLGTPLPGESAAQPRSLIQPSGPDALDAFSNNLPNSSQKRLDRVLTPTGLQQSVGLGASPVSGAPRKQVIFPSPLPLSGPCKPVDGRKHEKPTKSHLSSLEVPGRKGEEQDHQRLSAELAEVRAQYDVAKVEIRSLKDQLATMEQSAQVERKIQEAQYETEIQSLREQLLSMEDSAQRREEEMEEAVAKHEERIKEQLSHLSRQMGLPMKRRLSTMSFTDEQRPAPARPMDTDSESSTGEQRGPEANEWERRKFFKFTNGT
ncbi:hypothetical protein C8J56DRAFT_398267 [Mycena floridula]|nr:hypothetical protein C8J56DRAFT_398267 [Mycena floridula]